jgi:hypothetical protein
MVLKHARTLKVFLISLLSILTFFGVERLCHLATDGFALARMTHPLPNDKEFAPPSLPSEERINLLKILSQPFYYLSCGGQAYVFASEDGHYVIKFLKFHHRRIPSWMQKLPLPKQLDLYRLSKMDRKEARLKRNLKSYVLAYDYFKEETGMIYHHLENTHDLKQNLMFFDKMGYRYVIDLDHCAFVVQKRGLSTYYMINNLMKEGKIEETKEKLSQLLALSVRRCQKGLGDRDFKFKSNLGFIDNVASQIDLGSLSLDNRYTYPEFYKAEINHAAKKFRSWLEKEYPILVDYFDEELEKLNTN